MPGGREILRALVVLVLSLCAGSAAADLYRWVDPETGSVKFSSYPPPWFGDTEKEKRAPKVEHIPERKSSSGTPVSVPGATGLPGGASAPAGQGASLEALDQQRKRLLLEISSASAQKELQSGGAALKKQIDGFAAVSTEMDRLDPAGSERRRAEAQAVLEKLVEGARSQPKTDGR